MLGLSARARRFGARWGSRLRDEVAQVLDLDRWRTAVTTKERLAAISWPRAAIAAGGVAAISAGVLLLTADRGPYPPPMPSAADFAFRVETAKSMRPPDAVTQGADDQSVRP